MTTLPSGSRPHPLAVPVRLLLLAVATAGAWLAWCGIGSDGVLEDWQVFGCVVTLVVIGLVSAGWRLPPSLAALTVTVVFTASWCLTQMPQDPTGLSAVGAVILFLGLGVTSAVWYAVAHGITGGPDR